MFCRWLRNQIEHFARVLACDIHETELEWRDTVRRPVWGPGNLTGGREPKWGRAGSGRKALPVNKDVKENLADSDAIPNPIFWINGSNCTWNNGSSRSWKNGSNKFNLINVCLRS